MITTDQVVEALRLVRGVTDKEMSDSDVLGPALDEAAPLAAALNKILAESNSPVGWGDHLVMDGRSREPEDFTAPA